MTYHLLANNPHIRFHPLAVWDTPTLASAALSGWRAPEPDIIELIEPIGGTAGIGQEFVALAGRRNGWDRTKPGCQIALKLWVE